VLGGRREHKKKDGNVIEKDGNGTEKDEIKKTLVYSLSSF
jgi:hypothetical protein